MNRRVALALTCAVALMPGCSEDSTRPSRGLSLADIEGGWEVAGQRIGGEVHDLPDDYGFWYFASNGDHCSQWRTAYGTFLDGLTGKVSPQWMILTVDSYSGEDTRWALSLSANADTLHANSTAPDSSYVEAWILVPAVDPPVPPCLD